MANLITPFQGSITPLRGFVHVSRLTFHVSRFTSHVSRLTSHVSRFFHCAVRTPRPPCCCDAKYSRRAANSLCDNLRFTVSRKAPVPPLYANPKGSTSKGQFATSASPFVEINPFPCVPV